MPDHYGHYARILHWCTDQAMTDALSKMDLTASQGQIIGYLAWQKSPPCSRDIEDAFQLSHPTVSGLLARLAKKDFIEFRPDPDDRRCKRIWLLPKGQACHEAIRQTIEGIEAQLVQNFTDAEKEQFSDLLRRAIRNMGVGPCHPKHKEESDQ